MLVESPCFPHTAAAASSQTNPTENIDVKQEICHNISQKIPEKKKIRKIELFLPKVLDFVPSKVKVHDKGKISLNKLVIAVN